MNGKSIEKILKSGDFDQFVIQGLKELEQIYTNIAIEGKSYDPSKPIDLLKYYQKSI